MVSLYDPYGSVAFAYWCLLVGWMDNYDVSCEHEKQVVIVKLILYYYWVKNVVLHLLWRTIMGIMTSHYFRHPILKVMQRSLMLNRLYHGTMRHSLERTFPHRSNHHWNDDFCDYDVKNDVDVFLVVNDGICMPYMWVRRLFHHLMLWKFVMDPSCYRKFSLNLKTLFHLRNFVRNVERISWNLS